jgi:hypothetical protein
MLSGLLATTLRRLSERAPDALTAATRAFLDSAPFSATALEAASADWRSTLTLAEQQRIAPLLYAALADCDVPAAVLARLRVAWVAAQRQYLLAACQLRDIVRALGDAGVPAVVLKGPALAETY